MLKRLQREVTLLRKQLSDIRDSEVDAEMRLLQDEKQKVGWVRVGIGIGWRLKEEGNFG